MFLKVPHSTKANPQLLQMTCCFHELLYYFVSFPFLFSSVSQSILGYVQSYIFLFGISLITDVRIVTNINLLL